jgi:hypothetical protein
VTPCENETGLELVERINGVRMILEHRRVCCTCDDVHDSMIDEGVRSLLVVIFSVLDMVPANDLNLTNICILFPLYSLWLMIY